MVLNDDKLIINCKIDKVIFSCLLLIFLSIANADTGTDNKGIRFKIGASEYTKEQYEALSEEALKTLPVLDSISIGMTVKGVKAKNPKSILKTYESVIAKNRKLVIFYFQKILRDLGYLSELPSFGETETYKNAVKEFQISIGSHPTGELLGWEAEKLSKLDASFQPISIDFANNSVYHFFCVDNYLSTSGSWIKNGDDTKSMNPNMVKITCKKTEKCCREIYVAINPERSLLDNYAYSIDMSENNYEVGKWNDTEIIAVDDISSSCYVKTLIINLKSKKVYVKSAAKILDENSPAICFPDGKALAIRLGLNPHSNGDLVVLGNYSESYKNMYFEVKGLREKAVSSKYRALLEQCERLKKEY